MSFVLPPLPYPLSGLAPFISEETVDYHYNKHNLAYVNKLNDLLKDTDDSELSLEEVMKKYPIGPIYNNAAQIWNHRVYWQSMGTQHHQKPKGMLADAIERDFGSVEKFVSEFNKRALTQFGSGWAWLLSDKKGVLSIAGTPNAENMANTKQTTLIACDVWEHAYYIDTRNDRGAYLDNFWQVVNYAYAQSIYENINTSAD